MDANVMATQLLQEGNLYYLTDRETLTGVHNSKED